MIQLEFCFGGSPRGPGTTENTCVVCGAGFPRSSRGRPAKYCSSACWSRCYNGTIAPSPRPCVTCGEVFTPKQNRVTVCSSKCRTRRDNGSVLPKPRACSICGAGFTPKCDKVLQCSVACRGK